jgi:hypothetical protein
METFDLHNRILGHSINNPEVKNYIDFLSLTLDYENNWHISYNNREKGVYFEFEHKDKFENEFGSPKSFYTKDESELILKEVTFENNYLEKKKDFEIQLPYNLKIGDSVEEIYQKIGKKPYEKNKGTSYDKTEYNYYFKIDNIKILIKLDEFMKFVWIRFWLICLSEKYVDELKKSLAKQNKNLNVKNIETISNLKTKTPTKSWEIRMNEGDDMFKQKDIEFAQKVLETFIDTICEATVQKKATKIYSAIKKVVFSFNRNGDYIETLEREELVDFILESVILTGFKIDDNSDLTQQWREW